MKNLIKNLFKSLGYSIEKNTYQAKPERQYHKYESYTMIPKDIYVDNLLLIQKHAMMIDGDIVECGVWRGGMIAGIASLLGDARNYHLFDSFEGLPVAKDIDGEAAKAWQSNLEGDNYHNNCTAEINYAQTAMKLSEATSYKLHKGWFNETLPQFKTAHPIAVLRLDGDWYESTMDCLSYLYPLVNHNGLIIIDDYFAWDGCSKAVHDYLSSIKSDSRIYSTQKGICYIIKKDSYNVGK